MTNKQIAETIVEEGYSMTDNIQEAIYLLEDGQMVSGDFDMGMRGTDHRMIEVLFEDMDRDDGVKFWNAVHDMGIVRLVPEYMTGLIKEGQELTDIQKIMMVNAGYEIEEY